MSANQILAHYERRVTPIERLLSLSPYSIVTMVVRIKGSVSEDMLARAVAQVRQRHRNLGVRMVEDNRHDRWLTSAGAGEIPIQIVLRDCEDRWVQVFHDACRVPFEFEVRPPIRFILVQSPAVSELIIFCHHIICDGLSLAYLARDLLGQLGDLTRTVDVLPNPAPVDKETIPPDVSLRGIAKFFIKRINQKWAQNPLFFDQEDYRSLNEAYWSKYTHQMLIVELSEEQTSTLVERCRKQNVTVNTALTTAFVGAQCVVQGDKPFHSDIGIAASVRDRLRQPVGEAMGFFAAMVMPKCKYEVKLDFWENARRFHQKISPLFTDKNLFQALLTWCYLAPSILEAFHFKRLGGLVPPQSPRYEKLSAFGQRDDVVLALLKREKMDSLDRIFMGTAVTNLTRLDFPRTYGALELDRLIMNPGGAFPLTNVNLVLGAVTCAGKLSLVVEYVEQTVDTSTMEKIKEKALTFLLN